MLNVWIIKTWGKHPSLYMGTIYWYIEGHPVVQK